MIVTALICFGLVTWVAIVVAALAYTDDSDDDTTGWGP
jgi:hypothetical protein